MGWSAENFYPRPPRGGRPGSCIFSGSVLYISIHALRGEGDLLQRPAVCHVRFLSTPSAGRATAVSALDKASYYLFLSTPSAGRATTPDAAFRSPVPVFLSTPSAGRATTRQRARLLDCGISIHALRGEGDNVAPTVVLRGTPFLSTPSAGRATGKRANSQS